LWTKGEKEGGSRGGTKKRKRVLKKQGNYGIDVCGKRFFVGLGKEKSACG